MIACSSSSASSAARSVMSPLHDGTLGVGREPQPPVVGAEVEADDLDALLREHGARPRADAAERTGDEEALARSRIDVDRDRLGVELDRRAALLVRAEAARLDPAERHVHLGAGGLRVDVEQARLRLVLEARRRRRLDVKIAADRPNSTAFARSQRLVERREAVERRRPGRTPPRTRGTRRRRRPRTRSARSGSRRRRRARRPRSRCRPRAGRARSPRRSRRTASR